MTTAVLEPARVKMAMLMMAIKTAKLMPTKKATISMSKRAATTIAASVAQLRLLLRMPLLLRLLLPLSLPPPPLQLELMLLLLLMLSL